MTSFVLALLLVTLPVAAAPVPRIGIVKAHEMALRRAPGTVAKGEYEREGGVDARTGRIIEDTFEGRADRD